MKKTLALGLACAVLAGCSGGDDDEGPRGVTGNNDPSTAAALSIPGTAVSALANDSEYDFYRVTIPAGVTSINIQTFDQGGTVCDPQNENVDTYVEVYDASSTFITSSDDSGSFWCEDFNVTVVPGAVYYVVLSGYPPYPFTYTVKVSAN
jgi:hypothetical protein